MHPSPHGPPGADPTPPEPASHPAITADAAAHVLWHYRQDGGYEPGSFVRKLIEAITAADPINRQRLTLGFPAYVAAVQVAETNPAGFVALEAIAEGEPETDSCPACMRMHFPWCGPEFQYNFAAVDR